MDDEQAAFDALVKRFRELWSFIGQVEPVVGEEELRAAIAALGLAPHEVNEAWLSWLDENWVFGMADGPYAQEELNRAYQRCLRAEQRIRAGGLSKRLTSAMATTRNPCIPKCA